MLSPRRPHSHGPQQATPVLTPRRRAAHADPQAIEPPASSGLWAGLAAGLIVVAMGYLFYSAIDRPDRYASGVLVAPVFLVVAFLLGRLLARKERSFDIASIVLAGGAARVLGVVLRDQNASDGAVYFDVGRQLSNSFRQLQFDVDTQREFPGTGFLRYLSGLVQVVTFNDRHATFVMFTLFALLGATFFYLAFARGLPDGDRQRYAALVFLWPSMAYWPSSLGKEAWMIMCMGLASYGAARVLSNDTLRGFLLTILGIAGTSMVRPHVSMIVMAAAAAAILVRRPATVSRRLGGRTVVRRVGGGAKAIAVVLVLVGGGYLATQTSAVLKLDESGSDAIGAGLESTQAQTQQGNSAFTPFTVRNPANYPPAAVTVLFRPFPFEARGVESLITATEGLILLALVAMSFRRLLRLPSLMRREAYAAYATFMIVVFVYAFSSIGNFGILARQRTQILPLVFVLVCLPAAVRAVRGHPPANGTDEEDAPVAPATSAEGTTNPLPTTRAAAPS